MHFLHPGQSVLSLNILRSWVQWCDALYHLQEASVQYVARGYVGTVSYRGQRFIRMIYSVPSLRHCQIIQTFYRSGSSWPLEVQVVPLPKTTAIHFALGRASFTSQSTSCCLIFSLQNSQNLEDNCVIQLRYHSLDPRCLNAQDSGLRFHIAAHWR